MKFFVFLLLPILTIPILFSSGPGVARQASPLQISVTKLRVAGGLPNAVSVQNKLARLNSEKTLNLMTLVLAPRDAAGLQQFLEDQQNPASPLYHQWLTPEAFGSRFGRPEVEYGQLASWLKATGLRVVKTWPNRLQVTFEGESLAVERAFDVEMNTYRLGEEVGYAPDRAPAVPSEFAQIVRGIVGLHSFTRFRPMHHLPSGPTTREAGHSGVVPAAPGNLIAPADIAVAYNLKLLLANGMDGTGVSIAIASQTDFNLSDPQSFRSRFGLPAKDPVKLFPFGPQKNLGGGDETETVLDCEWSGAVAPDATVQAVIAPGIDTSLQAIVNNLPGSKVIDISYGGCETFSNTEEDAQFFDMLYAQAAAQGQSVFVSSGDHGVSDCVGIGGPATPPSVNFLASSPNVIGVGGTNLNALFDGSGNSTGYGGETAWSGSGGGDSVRFAKPAFQKGVGVPNNAMRNVPDVALLAGSPGYALFVRGFSTAVAGTSVAAPCWAGLCAILIEARQAGALGNINPEIYRLGNAQAAGTGPQVFHDVTTGNNNFGGVRGFDAQPGYDRVTGWGSFDGDALVRNFNLTPVADTVSPTVTILSPQGGEQATQGRTFQIRWTSSDNVGVVRHEVFLSLDGGTNLNYNLASGLAGNAQAFDWMVPTTLNSYDTLNGSTTARIAVRATDAGFNSTTAVSKADFTLVLVSDTKPPVVHVVAPNGGEKLKAGGSYTILWTSSDDVGVVSHDVLLSTNGGNSFNLSIAAGLAGTTQSFVYSVPSTINKIKTARVRVVAKDKAGNTGQDDSDANFKIKAK